MKIKGMLLFYVHRYLHSIYLILPLPVVVCFPNHEFCYCSSVLCFGHRGQCTGPGPFDDLGGLRRE